MAQYRVRRVSIGCGVTRQGAACINTAIPCNHLLWRKFNVCLFCLFLFLALDNLLDRLESLLNLSYLGRDDIRGGGGGI
jgi:hypothetical protein